jgi:hypothetical protein
MQAEHMLEVLAAVAPSPPGEFGSLATAVLARRAILSSVILILLSWDKARARLVAALRATGSEVRALLVCPEGAAPAERPAGVVVLHPGAIEKGLAGLR